jgi:hypothetical protein
VGRTLHASPMPKSLRVESCRREKSKGNTDLQPNMNLDDFGAPIFSIDIVGSIIRKIFMQPS